MSPPPQGDSSAGTSTEAGDPIPTFRPLICFVRSVKLLVIIGIMLALFPPWRQTFTAKGMASSKPAGYAPLWSPPKREVAWAAYGVELDLGRLLLQYVSLAGVALLLRLRGKPHE